MNLTLLFLSVTLAAPSVNLETAKNIAVKKAALDWPSARFGTTIRYYDFDGAITAYAFVFSLTADPFPDYNSLAGGAKTGRTLARQAAKTGDTELLRTASDLTWGVNRYGTIVVAARVDQMPIIETANCLPRYFTTLDLARNRAQKILKANASFTRIYYQAPEDEWFGFTDGSKEILINTYSLQVYDRDQFQTRGQVLSEPASSPPPLESGLALQINQTWERLTQSTVLTRSESGYVDSVPYCLWSYGCSPTASAMIMWYWDERGYGRLVDFFFDRYDAVEGDQDINMPNVQQELAIGMDTDSMSGSTWGKVPISNGHNYVANVLNHYSFRTSPSPDGNQSNGWVYHWIVAEIKADRPCHWAVFHYFPDAPSVGHSLCAVGYEVDSAGDSLVIVHNTWDTGEHKWALWVLVQGTPSTDFVVRVIPDGDNPNNISLTFPQSSDIVCIAGLQYPITWQTTGSDIDRVSLWYLKSAKKNEWQLITQSLPNSGSYAWTVPAESAQARIAIAGYDENIELADDGSVPKFTIRTLPHSTTLELLGHMNTVAFSAAASPPYLYINQGVGGIGVVDISNPALPKAAGSIQLPGYVQNLFINRTCLYVACQAEGLRIVDLANPHVLSEIGYYKISDKIMGISVKDSFAFLAADKSGLIILNIKDPKNPKKIGSLTFAGSAYDLIVDGSTCYIAGLSEGFLVVDVTDPAHPVMLNQLETTGPAVALAVRGGYLYAAMGAAGLEIIELAHPTNRTVFETQGQARSLALGEPFLYVARGYSGTLALDITNPASPKEAGSVGTLYNTYGVSSYGQYLYVSDGNTGAYIIKNPEAAIAEATPRHQLPVLTTPSPNPFSRRTVLKFSLPQRSDVSFSVFDPAGRLVRDLAAGKMDAGIHAVVWEGTDKNGKNVAPGVYFYRFQTGNFTRTGKFILIR